MFHHDPEPREEGPGPEGWVARIQRAFSFDRKAGRERDSLQRAAARVEATVLLYRRVSTAISTNFRYVDSTLVSAARGGEVDNTIHIVSVVDLASGGSLLVAETDRGSDVVICPTNGNMWFGRAPTVSKSWLFGANVLRTKVKSGWSPYGRIDEGSCPDRVVVTGCVGTIRHDRRKTYEVLLPLFKPSLFSVDDVLLSIAEKEWIPSYIVRTTRASWNGPAVRFLRNDDAIAFEAYLDALKVYSKRR